MKKIFFLLAFLLFNNVFALSQSNGNSRKAEGMFKSVLKNTKILSREAGRSRVGEPYDSAIIGRIVNYIQNNQASRVSYYFLVRLNIHHLSVYDSISNDVKANIFCYAFTDEKDMDDWGILMPDSQKEYAVGRLLLSFGKTMLPCLAPTLYDNKRVNFGWNFETLTIPIEYKWRKKDFAYRYAALILKETPIFLKQPEERDKVIKAFIEKYEKEFAVKN